jgi:hypothetical protein
MTMAVSAVTNKLLRNFICISSKDVVLASSAGPPKTFTVGCCGVAESIDSFKLVFLLFSIIVAQQAVVGGPIGCNLLQSFLFWIADTVSLALLLLCAACPCIQILELTPDSLVSSISAKA